jgi:enoyl-CoA hydratase/carnithine racemase
MGNYLIGQPEVLLGIMPGGSSSQPLPRLIGNHKALVAILSGEPFTPAQALEVAITSQLPTTASIEGTVAVHGNQRQPSAVRMGSEVP